MKVTIIVCSKNINLKRNKIMHVVHVLHSMHASLKLVCYACLHINIAMHGLHVKHDLHLST